MSIVLNIDKIEAREAKKVRRKYNKMHKKTLHLTIKPTFKNTITSNPIFNSQSYQRAVMSIGGVDFPHPKAFRNISS